MWGACCPSFGALFPLMQPLLPSTTKARPVRWLCFGMVERPGPGDPATGDAVAAFRRSSSRLTCVRIGGAAVEFLTGSFDLSNLISAKLFMTGIGESQR